MKDYFLWFLFIFVAVAACIVCYKNGYAEGYKLGSATYPAIYPHSQTTPPPQADKITPQGGY